MKIIARFAPITTKIKEKLKELACYDSFFLLFIFLLTLIYTGQFFLNFIAQEGLVGGWDGSSHLAVAKQYSDSIFPNPFGWISNWYAGIPWPLGYPPLFYYVVALFGHLLPFLKFELVFKLILIFCTFLFPILSYFIAKKIGYSKILSFLTSVLTIFFLMTPAGKTGGYGITFFATFQSGLIPQFFSGIFLLLWFYFLLSAQKQKRDFYLSTILLALVFLSNIHTGEAALIILFGFFVTDTFYRGLWKSVKHYGLSLILATLLIAFWAIPLIQNLNYFLNKTFPPVKTEDFINVVVILGIGLAGGLLGALKEKEEKKRIFISILLSGMMILLFTTLKIINWFPSLPIQQFRLFPFSYLLFLFIVPEFFIWLSTIFKLSKRHVIFGILIFLIPLFYSLRPLPPHLNLSVLFPSERQLLQKLYSLHEGRSLIEANAPGYPNHYDIAALAGITKEHETIWTVFRESAINSPFIMPLRNLFSFSQESFGVVCMLCGDAASSDLYEQPMHKNVSRAQLYGVRYFVIRSEPFYQILNSDKKNFKFLDSFTDWFGSWNLFELKEPAPLAEIPKKEPILIFTDLKSKERPFQNSYDWLRINEEWFYHAKFDTSFALAKNQFLDESNDFKNFEIALLFQYKYHNLQNAVNKILAYSKEHKIFFAIPKNETNPLIDKLKENKNENVLFFTTTGDVRRDMAELIDTINKINPYTQKSSNVASLAKKNGIISVQLQDISTTKNKLGKKVFLKYSYSPAWKDKNGGTVYMASPALMLITTDKNSIELEFNLGIGLLIGMLISLSTLGGIVILIRKVKKKN